MQNSSVQILEGLSPGSEAQLYSDAMALQIGKIGTTVAAALCAVSCVYYILCSMGALGTAKRSIFAIIAFIVAGVGAYFLYQKSLTFTIIDDQRPIIVISSRALEYDVRRDGWSLPWGSIRSIDLHETTTQAKQSVEQTSYEIRVIPKEGANISWKYEPSSDNDIDTTKKLYNQYGYLLINPEPLGISPEILQKALEKYRSGL